MVSKRLRRLLSTVALLGVCFCLNADTSAAGDPFLGFDGPVLPNPAIPTPWMQTWGTHAADFNEDGLMDVAIVGETGVLILLGNGDCTFSSDFTFFAGLFKSAVADFNEDNHQDIVMADGGNGAGIILGNGDGSFGPPSSVNSPSLPPQQTLMFGIAVADFNADNHEDLILGSYLGNQLSFFSGNGDGTFDTAVTFGGAPVWDIRGGDFNEDGNLDFIAGRLTPQVWLGAGNGTFTGGGTFPVGDDPEGLVVFDFNGDTHLDFATANASTNDVSVRLGNGDGTFAAETRYTVGSQPRYLKVYDVDADGNADLMIGSQEDAISVLAGNGDGTFDPETRIPMIHTAGPTAIADFDGDGRDDLAVTSYSWRELIILPGHGDGFSGADPATIESEDPFGSGGATFGDLNKDGLQDAVRVRDDGAMSISVMLADGAGGFTHSWTSAAGTGVSGVAIADFNNDTNPDIIVTNRDSNDASILLGNGDGSFAPMFSIPLVPGPRAIATGLFNNDSNVDIAVLSTVPAPSVFVLTGNGDATFSPSGVRSVGTDPVSVHTGDFDEDGETDLVVVNAGSTDLSVLLGVGNGTFQPEVRYALNSSSVLTIADVDSDGHQDLLLTNNQVLFGVGDGTFGASEEVGPGFTQTHRVGDLNGDGRVDLVGASNQVVLRLGQDDGSFGAPSFSVGNGFPGAIILEDADGDGRLDVIMSVGTQVMTLLNVEPSPFNFLNDKITLRWPDVDGALSYNVYRGLLSTLTDGDGDGLPDTGYGDCQNTMDPDTTDLNYVDASVPAPNTGYFYVIAVVDWAGERYLGTTSDGLPRVPTLPCP